MNKIRFELDCRLVIKTKTIEAHLIHLFRFEARSPTSTPILLFDLVRLSVRPSFRPGSGRGRGVAPPLLETNAPLHDTQNQFFSANEAGDQRSRPTRHHLAKEASIHHGHKFLMYRARVQDVAQEKEGKRFS